MSGKFQTFQPSVYLDWEKEAIEARIAKAKAGPPKGRGAPDTVNEYELLKYNRTWDPYNPLFSDKDYAQKAGYPSIPAWPCHKGPMAGGTMELTIPMDFTDTWYYANDGGDMEFYTHFFAGDTFFSEADSLGFEELTVPGSDLRHFKMSGSASMYNEKGELVARSKSSLRNAYRKIIDGSPKPSFSENMSEWVAYFPPGHYTTDEEWEYIKQLWDKEYIRGKNTLYWEDVNIGDEPTPTCSGPISYLDMVGYGGFPVDKRAVIKNAKTMFRDKYGIYLNDTALHYGGRNIPGSRAVFYNGTAAMHIVRMVTNYIGDAGLVTRVCWRFKQFFKEMWVERPGGEILDKVPYMKGKECTRHGAESDTVIGKGYVTDKYINDKGEHIIDISCWGETLDDNIIQIVGASARLPSRENK